MQNKIKNKKNNKYESIKNIKTKNCNCECKCEKINSSKTKLYNKKNIQKKKLLPIITKKIIQEKHIYEPHKNIIHYGTEDHIKPLVVKHKYDKDEDFKKKYFENITVARGPHSFPLFSEQNSEKELLRISQMNHYNEKQKKKNINNQLKVNKGTQISEDLSDNIIRNIESNEIHQPQFNNEPNYDSWFQRNPEFPDPRLDSDYNLSENNYRDLSENEYNRLVDDYQDAIDRIEIEMNEIHQHQPQMDNLSENNYHNLSEDEYNRLVDDYQNAIDRVEIEMNQNFLNILPDDNILTVDQKLNNIYDKIDEIRLGNKKKNFTDEEITLLEIYDPEILQVINGFIFQPEESEKPEESEEFEESEKSEESEESEESEKINKKFKNIVDNQELITKIINYSLNKYPQNNQFTLNEINNLIKRIIKIDSYNNNLSRAPRFSKKEIILISELQRYRPKLYEKILNRLKQKKN